MANLGLQMLHQRISNPVSCPVGPMSSTMTCRHAGARRSAPQRHLEAIERVVVTFGDAPRPGRPAGWRRSRAGLRGGRRLARRSESPRPARVRSPGTVWLRASDHSSPATRAVLDAAGCRSASSSVAESADGGTGDPLIGANRACDRDLPPLSPAANPVGTWRLFVVRSQARWLSAVRSPVITPITIASVSSAGSPFSRPMRCRRWRTPPRRCCACSWSAASRRSASASRSAC